MGDFFKPWRRKIGVLTLGLACVLMAVWLKTSFGDRDWCLQVPQFPILHHFWIAHEGLGWRTQEQSGDAKDSLEFKLRWIVSINKRSDFINRPKLNGEVVGGFRFDETTTELPTGGRYTTRIWIVPYWSIVSPLTLISIWLLLSKPRKSTPKKMVQLISETVT
jgi:hypothetical protein